jgi:hypothetical protein
MGQAPAAGPALDESPRTDWTAINSASDEGQAGWVTCWPFEPLA